jgi:hypothetical protein
MTVKNVYKVIFVNQGKVYEVYAKQVAQSGMFGFIEIEQLVFGEKSAVVIDPSEERLKDEFKEVKRTYIPMHSIIRIDEVEKEGTAKIVDIKGDAGQVVGFPGTFYSKQEAPKKDT